MKRFMLVVYLFVIAMGNASTGTAQWAMTVGGWEFDQATSVVPTPDGGMIVAGATRSFDAGGGSDGWLFKLDNSGMVVWEERIATDASDAISDLAMTSDGMNMIAVTGNRIIKLNTTGGIVWQKEVFSDDECFISKVSVDTAGNAVLVGNIYSEPNGDIWVVKVDPLGNILWQERLGGDNVEHASDVIATADGGYLIAGVAYSFGSTNGDVWLIKLTAAGTIIWQRTFGLYFGGNENIEFDGYVMENSGGYLLAIHTAPLPSGNSDLWMLQLNSAGVIQWQKMYETLSDFAVIGMVDSGDGGSILVGRKGDLFSPTPVASGWTMKLDSVGAVQWINYYRAPTPFAYSGYDPLNGITRLMDGRLGLVGGSESFAIENGIDRKDAWVFLADSGGEVTDCGAVELGLVPVATDTTEPDVTTAAVAIATTATAGDGTAVPAVTLSFIGDGCQGTVRDFVDLPKTGLTTSYYPGDDGELQAGVAWPPQRFVDNGNGTVSDRLTGLMWLKDANCASTIGHDPDAAGNGKMIWASSLDFVAGINSGMIDISDCSLYIGDFDDWRLANINELAGLINNEVMDRTGWLNGQGFENVQDYTYWTSTPTAGYIYQHYRWVVEFNTSRIRTRSNGSPYHAWPVRSGQVGEGNPDPSYAANVWRTGKTTSIHPGDDGEVKAGVRWPGQRFVNNGDGTITDSLTGLTWLQDTQCLGSLEWTVALDTVADFNINPGSYSCANYGATPHRDWRLANRVEMRSLFDYQTIDPPFPGDHQFMNLQTGYLWTSNTDPTSTLQAWSFELYSGQMQILSKSVYTGWIIPVRGKLSGSGNPVAKIQANGSDGPLTISRLDNLTIAVSLQPGSHAGERGDYWLNAETPMGSFYFAVGGGWINGQGITHQGPIIPLTDFTVLDRNWLPPGDYILNFGIDLDENGVVDMNQFFQDSVEVTVTP